MPDRLLTSRFAQVIFRETPYRVSSIAMSPHLYHASIGKWSEISGAQDEAGSCDWRRYFQASLLGPAANALDVCADIIAGAHRPFLLLAARYWHLTARKPLRRCLGETVGHHYMPFRAGRNYRICISPASIAMKPYAASRGRHSFSPRYTSSSLPLSARAGALPYAHAAPPAPP